ncbi:ABC transporter ATP-binding protein [Ilumatobacter nonamiensis]|uniref:ABC transporter ATP-binding protein n=1 Tax=Ilumatobacter nonamiensis TaxID=467093 RepID=UPI00034C15A1|nr:ABC transporter ATP-binding protein [Ilumatobacter nonamiensis]
MSTSALRVGGVTKRFGEVVAVDDVSFDVADTELLALVGPSGCGKSTLLRLIAGLFPSDGGVIELDGVVADDEHTSLPPEKRRVGLVFQEHALFPHLSVAKNVGFGVRASTSERNSRVSEMLDLVGMSGYTDRFPHELSGGERQRVALARALAPRPALMLLDEPFASLDPNLRVQIRDDVVDILRSTRTPAVFVTHDQNEALAVGDRVAVMNAGRVAQLDTPEQIFHRPASRFVASFMGEADFLSPADVRDGLGGHEFVATDVDPADSGDLMVRPDDIEFEPSADGGATVTGVEFRGSSRCYTLQLRSGATVRSLRSHLVDTPIDTHVRPSLVPGHRPVPIAD